MVHIVFVFSLSLFFITRNIKNFINEMRKAARYTLFKKKN